MRVMAPRFEFVAFVNDERLRRRFVNSCVQHRFPGGELDLPKAMVVPILFSNLCQITMEIEWHACNCPEILTGCICQR